MKAHLIPSRYAYRISISVSSLLVCIIAQPLVCCRLHSAQWPTANSASACHDLPLSFGMYQYEDKMHFIGVLCSAFLRLALIFFVSNDLCFPILACISCRQQPTPISLLLSCDRLGRENIKLGFDHLARAGHYMSSAESHKIPPWPPNINHGPYLLRRARHSYSTTP